MKTSQDPCRCVGVSELKINKEMKKENGEKRTKTDMGKWCREEEELDISVIQSASCHLFRILCNVYPLLVFVSLSRSLWYPFSFLLYTFSSPVTRHPISFALALISGSGLISHGDDSAGIFVPILGQIFHDEMCDILPRNVICTEITLGSSINSSTLSIRQLSSTNDNRTRIL